MRIAVTEKHILDGVQNDPKHCPIALAFGSVITAPGLDVGGCSVELTAGIYVRIPAKVGRFIQDFDHGTPVKPFSFETSDPIVYQRPPGYPGIPELGIAAS